MRTTLNIDDDVSAQLADLARRKRLSLSRMANELIRAGLRDQRAVPTARPFIVEVFDSGDPLMDVTDAAAALSALDDD